VALSDGAGVAVAGCGVAVAVAVGGDDGAAVTGAQAEESASARMPIHVRSIPTYHGGRRTDTFRM
jgi:hypothetical protein